MSNAITEVLPRKLLEQWAVQVWNQLGVERKEPEAIETVKLKSKSAVYRVGNRSSIGSTAIAKRCFTQTAEVEQRIYQQLLPRLGLPALRCYGYLSEPLGDYSWLLLEDAAGLEYSPLCEPHRVLAGKWLGALHCAARDCGRLSGLPDRDCDYYRDELRFVTERIQMLLSHRAVPPEDLPLLRHLAGQCELIEAHWEQLREWCSAFPRTLVHGDFAVKNVRFRSTPVSEALLVFDWEVAGWGVPATDLAQDIGGTVSPDLAAYGQAMADCGLPLDSGLVERLVQCGGFFRVLDCMRWSCQWGPEDSYLYLSKPISSFRSYSTRLAQLLSSVGWSK